MTPVVVPALFLVALALVLLFEWRREPRHRRPPRLGASALVVLGLLALSLVQGATSTRQILTPGAPVSARSREAVWLDRLASAASLWTGKDERSLRLTGWGLLPHEWPDSLTRVIRFDAAPLPDGIVALDAPAEVGLGERLTISGQLNLAAHDRVWVVLDDPAGPRDSVQVGGRSPRFTVGDWPRAVTAAAYRLRVRAGSTVISEDTLGVAVRETRPPSVLIVDGSPSFESTFLKRWLSDRGGRIAIRTTVSRDRYRSEIVGPQDPPRGQIGRLDPSVLRRYDVLIIDGPALRALSASEMSAVRSAVVTEGMGVLVSADLRSAAEIDLVKGLGARGDGEEDWSVKPEWRDAPRRSSLAIMAEPAQLTPQGEALVRDLQGRTLAVARAAGNGRLGGALLRNPSRWVLEGEEDLYASYWQLLLGSVARDTVTRVSLASDGPRQPNHPVTITLTIPGAGERPRWPKVTIASPGGGVDTLPFARDPVDQRLWRSTYWPTTPGWHTLQLTGGRALPFRVSSAGAWKGLEASARLRATAARVNAAAAAPLTSSLPLRLFLFVVMVGLLTWLWVEPRLRR